MSQETHVPESARPLLVVLKGATEHPNNGHRSAHQTCVALPADQPGLRSRAGLLKEAGSVLARGERLAG